MPGSTSALAIGFVAWFVPGAGHFLTGQLRKGLIFFTILGSMTVLGLAFGGRLFPFQMTEPLVFLAAAAQWALGLPRMLAAMAGAGAGDVVAATYDYGNTFLIASGLLNVLVFFDAYDLARGRKAR
jgi:hypothetical protein